MAGAPPASQSAELLSKQLPALSVKLAVFKYSLRLSCFSWLLSDDSELPRRILFCSGHHERCVSAWALCASWGALVSDPLNPVDPFALRSVS